MVRVALPLLIERMEEKMVAVIYFVVGEIV